MRVALSSSSPRYVTPPKSLLPERPALTLLNTLTHRSSLSLSLFPHSCSLLPLRPPPPPPAPAPPLLLGLIPVAHSSFPSSPLSPSAAWRTELYYRLTSLYDLSIAYHDPDYSAYQRWPSVLVLFVVGR